MDEGYQNPKILSEGHGQLGLGLRGRGVELGVGLPWWQIQGLEQEQVQSLLLLR